MESVGGLTGWATGSPEDPGPASRPANDPPVLPTGSRGPSGQGLRGETAGRFEGRDSLGWNIAALEAEMGWRRLEAREIPQFIMNEEPAAICFNEDDYYCPVCQDVFKTPVRISICQHVFCRKCFLMAMKEGGTHCPLCRGIVTRKEKARPIRALDVENNMKKLLGSCRCCDKQIRFSRMRHHYKSCKKYQDEYGDLSIVPNLEISQDSTGSSGQPTYKCPLCPESNFTRQTLLDHCYDRHLYQIDPVICPICVSLPWGDPNWVTRDLVGHLNQRHQLDYGDFMNLQLDEETLFQNAIEESCQVNL